METVSYASYAAAVGLGFGAGVMVGAVFATLVFCWIATWYD